MLDTAACFCALTALSAPCSCAIWASFVGDPGDTPSDGAGCLCAERGTWRMRSGGKTQGGDMTMGERGSVLTCVCHTS